MQASLSRSAARRSERKQDNASLGRALKYLTQYRSRALIPYVFLVISALSQLAIPTLIRRVIDAVTSGYVADQVLQALDKIPAAMASAALPRILEALNYPADTTLDGLKAALTANKSGAPSALVNALLGEGLPPYRSADLLLPTADLGSLFPDTAAQWLTRHGAWLALGQRVTALHMQEGSWQLQGVEDGGAGYDHVVLACPVADGARLVRRLPSPAPQALEWLAAAEGLHYEPIATTYVLTRHTPAWPGPLPMLALRSGPRHGPAQFVFDRARLGGPSGLLAFVSSACRLDRESLQTAVLAQAREQLDLQDAEALLTVVEKRATFACTPALKRPDQRIAPGLWAAGDAIDGPYPATLEGAIRSGMGTVGSLPR